VARRVAEARALAREKGIRLYLVGGAVRDVLLGHEGLVDVDLVVESDAAVFARALARRLRADLKLHGRFGTAVLEVAGGARIDLATARSESYDRPGALPRVRPGTIQDDLARRDFTINAMAMEIAGPGAPRLIDPSGGRGDLRRGLVRMLHERSPFDDPTRSFRAARYANRLGFRVEARTRRWIVSALDVIDAVSGDRIRRELALLLSERNRASAAGELARLGVSAAVHPALRFGRAASRRLANAERLASETDLHPSWIVYLLSWMGPIDERTADEIALRLNLPGRDASVVRAWPRTGKRVPPSASNEELLAAAADLPAAAGRRFLDVHRAAARVRLSIRGSDLLAAGVAPGPAIGRALSATLSARRDGSIRAEDELSFAVKAARS
jgi:tRNA nucleotidyltransferase (CCA-adding enzyme)